MADLSTGARFAIASGDSRWRSAIAFRSSRQPFASSRIFRARLRDPSATRSTTSRRTPRPEGFDILSGAPKERIHRVRVADYRILYQVFDDRLVVLVVRVADRREVYNQTFLKRLRKQLRSALR